MATVQTSTPMTDEALPLKCTVSSYSILKAYVEYEVTVQRGPFSENTWKILKRYSDFNDLNQKLIIFGITHPLPPKKFFGNMDPSFIQDRQLGLQTFIDHITQDPAIANTLLIQSFFDPSHFMERMHEEALEYVSMQLRSEPKWQIVESLKDFGWRQRKHYSLAKSKVDSKIPDHILIMVEYGPDIALNEKELISAFRTLCAIQHPYICTTTFAQPCEIGGLILREFNPEGSLKDYIYKSKPRAPYMKKYGGKGRALPVHEVKKFSRQIIEATLFLKEKGFILGHIHAGNVLLQSDICRLTDLENSLLGLSYHSRHHILNFKKIQTLESECVYNIGRLLYEMTFGETLRAGAIDSLPPTTPPQIRVLLENLITVTACKNGMPSLPDLLKDRFFEDCSLPISLMEKPALKVSTKLKESLRLAVENAEGRISTEQKSINHARRVSKAQERSMSEEGKKKRKMDQLRQMTEDTESDYPVSSLSNRSGTPTSHKTSNSTDRKQSSASKPESKETSKDPQSTISSIVSSGASEDSSHTGATDDRGRLLTSISSFNKIGLKKTDTQDRSVPNI